MTKEIKKYNYEHRYIDNDLNNEGNTFTHILKNDSNNINYNKFDYLHKIFVKINLPAIYSPNSRQFKWIKNLGFNIIEDVKCTISFKNSFNNKNNNQTTINIYTYTEWLYIWNELNLSEEEKKIHNELIGNIPELYDPGNALNRNNTYPVSHLKKETYRWVINDDNIKQASVSNIDIDYNYNKPASIPEKKLYIPLNFYFCNNINDILPLIIIDQIKIEIKVKPVENLYTVLLKPEDFVLSNETVTTQVSNLLFNQKIQLPNNIIFTNNKIPYFSDSGHITTTTTSKDDLSMFDVLINKYEIKPLDKGNTSINNFLKSNEEEVTNIQKNVNSLINFYDNICNISIIYNIVKYKPFNKTNIILKGLINPITKQNILNVGTANDGLKKDHNETISKIINNNISEIFFILRHSQRSNRNDLLNFTNLDYNNLIPWELYNKNSINYSADLELLSNSKWEHESTSSSIKIGINNEGTFFIKKQILENNIYRYVDILNYRSNNLIDNKSSLYNSDSFNFINESILKNFKLKINTSKNTYSITNNSEDYNFYNKVSVYQNYKNTIPGLFYINNSYENLRELEFSECIFNKIEINSSNEYECIIFCNENVTITYN